MCETDYSGYPDCRDDTLKSLQVTLNLGMGSNCVLHTPLMWIDKAATWAMAETLGGAALVNLVRDATGTPAMSATTRPNMTGAMVVAPVRRVICVKRVGKGLSRRARHDVQPGHRRVRGKNGFRPQRLDDQILSFSIAANARRDTNHGPVRTRRGARGEGSARAAMGGAGCRL